MGAFTGERVRILRMLEEGKVSVDEAARLLDALEGGGDGEAPRARRIRITVRESGLSPLHVTIPVGLVERACPPRRACIPAGSGQCRGHRAPRGRGQKKTSSSRSSTAISASRSSRNRPP